MISRLNDLPRSSEGVERGQADIESLPNEVLQLIFFYAGPRAIGSLLLTSKRFRILAEDPALWKLFCQTMPFYFETASSDAKNYRLLFQRLWRLPFNLTSKGYTESRGPYRDKAIRTRFAQDVLFLEYSGGLIEIYDTKNDEKEAIILPKNDSFLINCTASKEYIAIADSDGKVRIWDRIEYQEILCSDIDLPETNTSMEFIDGTLLFCSKSTKLASLNIADNRIEEYPIPALRCRTYREKTLFLQTSINELAIWSFTTGEILKTYSYTSSVINFCIDAHRNRLALVFKTPDTGCVQICSTTLCEKGHNKILSQNRVEDFHSIQWHLGKLWVVADQGSVYKITPSFKNPLTQLEVVRAATGCQSCFLSYGKLYEYKGFAPDAGMHIFHFLKTSKELARGIAKDYLRSVPLSELSERFETLDKKDIEGIFAALQVINITEWNVMPRHTKAAAIERYLATQNL